jgi:hypothetical protein
MEGSDLEDFKELARRYATGLSDPQSLGYKRMLKKKLDSPVEPTADYEDTLADMAEELKRLSGVLGKEEVDRILRELDEERVRNSGIIREMLGLDWR